jgi:hypothetical protein
MYAMYAGMNMIPRKATLITVLPPELHLTPFRTIGLARCVAWTKQISRKRKSSFAFRVH